MQDICAKLLQGFNCTVLATGQSGVGKTERVHGRYAWPAVTQSTPCSMLAFVVQRVLEKALSHLGTYQVGLSCWEMSEDQVCSTCQSGLCCFTREVFT
jgi:hypothetical protein